MQVATGFGVVACLPERMRDWHARLLFILHLYTTTNSAQYRCQRSVADHEETVD